MKLKKDPDAVLDYLVDFASKTNNNGKEDYLQIGEVILNHTAIASSSEITVDSSSLINLDTSVLLWISGGLLGKTYTITVRVVTSLGRTDDRSFQLQIVEK